MAVSKIEKRLPCNIMKCSPYSIHTMNQNTPSTTFTDLCPSDDTLLKQYIAPIMDANNMSKIKQTEGMYFDHSGIVKFMYITMSDSTTIHTALVFECAGRGVWALCIWGSYLMINKIW